MHKGNGQAVWGGAGCRRLVGSILLVGGLLAPPGLGAQTLIKAVEGKVLDAGTAPLPGAIVYLQDEKTNVVKTLISTADGSYNFSQLPADTDYNVWAEFKGKKSKVRLVNSFDTKLHVTQNFHISEK